MSKVFRFSKRHVMVALAALLIAAVFIGFLVWVYITENATSGVPASSDTTTTTTVPTRDQDNGIAVQYFNGKPYTENTGLETVLFLGIDKYAEDATDGSYINNQQADTLMLAVFDHDNKRMSLLPINRDTMTSISTYAVNGDFSGKETLQIALAHAYGNGWEKSCLNTTEAVSNLLFGVQIDHYFSMKMDAIPYLNDAVGGVEVSLTEDMTLAGESFANGQAVLLQGDQALSYVRGRAGLEDPTNVSRMQRQNHYLRLWSEQFTTELDRDNSFLISMLYDISPYYFSDMSEDHMNDLAQCLKSYTQDDALSIAGESRKGETYMEFHVDEDALRQLVVDLFYKSVE